MSHVATIDVQFTSLPAVLRACEKLGLEFRAKQNTYRWYGTWVDDYNAEDAAYRNGIDPKDYGKCDHAIGVPGDNQAYEVGLVKNPKGAGWVPIVDFFGIEGKKITDKVGKKCEALAQAYAAEVVKMESSLEDEGYELTETVLKDGSLVLEYISNEFS